MPPRRLQIPRFLVIPSLWGLCLLPSGCASPYEFRHENQWDARSQILVAEPSQVKLRAAQSRVFETTDRQRMIESIVATMQDLNFMVEVADEELGVVSGTLFVPLERPSVVYDPLYHLYNGESLMIFTRSYRSWAPFWQRSDHVRLTVTVRRRNEKQSVVRASLQFYLRAVEEPEVYQTFFRTLEQASFLQAQLAEGSETSPLP